MLTLEVKGMTCGHCVKAVTAAVKEVASDAEVVVDLDAGRVQVRGTANAAQVGAAIADAGYEVGAISQ